ncbi:MAG: hypothetical protein P4L35_00665 [Ignavibacteriaceae bacterium]|nr:hypothetical protein [Ignavibacteriaceae bacterium]
MMKMFFISGLFLITLIGCNSSVVESFSFERDTPAWLKIKIDSISTQKYYWGTVINRYKWNNNYLFEFTIPVSSCMFCDIYFYDGTKNKFIDAKAVQSYINTRTDKVFVWKYPTR